MEKITLKGLEKDIKVEGCLLIRSINERLTKNNEVYYQLTLTDGATEIQGNFFKPPVYEDYKKLEGEVVCFKIKTQVYNGNFGCIIDSLDLKTPINDKVKSTFLKFSAEPSNYPLYQQALVKLIESIEDSEIKQLCNYVFLEKYKKEFETYPAAKINHHAGFGGLLEHSVNLANIAIFFAEYYNYDYNLNKDYLIAGSLFQDVGKIFEYDLDHFYNAEYSKIGSLKGHITIGNEILYASLSELKIDTNQEKFAHISHILLSHHGELQFGSPATPHTPEAFLISRIDKLDADMKASITAIKSVTPEAETTNKIFNLGNIMLITPSAKLYNKGNNVQYNQKTNNQADSFEKSVDSLF